MRRRAFIAVLGGAAVALPLVARAQQPAEPRRVGVLASYDKDDPEIQGLLAVFHEAMGKLGWTEGQNLKFEYRWPGYNAPRLDEAAKELVALRPDLILSLSSPSTAFLLRQTRTIPVVFVNIVDPVGQGFVASLSHPGGNATGLVNLEPSMAGKWIELLKQVMPQLARVAIPFNPVSAPYADLYLSFFKSTASTFGVELVPGSIADLSALETFIATQAQQSNTGIIPMPSSFSTGHAGEIAAITTRYRLPGVYADRSFAAAGGLLSYGNQVSDNYRRAAKFVDGILRGQKPSELRVEFPTKFNLVINLKTAKTLGLVVPLALQASADEVIE